MCTRMGTVMLLGPVGRNTCKMAEIDDWDADDLATEEQPKKTAEVDNWDDEDVDDDPKDSWADEEAELKREEPQKTEIVTSEKKKQSEKEQEEVKESSEDHEEGAELTPEEGSETGEQQEKPAGEQASDATAVAGVPGGIDAMSPSSKEDFSEFEKVLKDKLCPYEGSVHYSGLLESLFQDLCISMEIEDLKKINSSLTSLLSEKQKQEKQLNKGKKKKKGAVTVGGMKAKLKDDLADYGQFEGGYTQDYEDFM